MRLSRRQLGIAALGAAAQAQTPAAKYTGALDGFEDKVNAAAFDPVAWTLSRYESMPRKLAFQASNRRQAQAWQKKLHEKLVELVGGFPKDHAPLEPRLLETKDYPTYTREKLVVTTRPGLAMLVYLLMPKQRTAPHPVMMCVAGHGRGVDDIVGIDNQGRDRTKREGYQFDFAIQAVEHGMAAVAVEVLAFGCRRGAQAKRNSLTASSCQPAAGAALLFGETMAGWRVYDMMRAIDWISTRKELDAARIGCVGISGGGTVTLFLSALDPRVKLAYVSGYMNTFRDSIVSLSHCIDNYVPGILQWAEMYDIAGLIAPRPLFIESGDKDNIFPIAASRASFEKVKQIYEVFGAGDKVAQQVFPGPHEFHGVDGWKFAVKHLVA